MNENILLSTEVTVDQIDNHVADDIFMQFYWLKRKRHSRRLSYSVFYKSRIVAWLQCADPFGTKLAKPLDLFNVNDAVELSRGYFLDNTPQNIESCAISKVLKRLSNDWFQQFEVIKKIAIVYQDLDFGQKGIVYKSLGFIPYAYTTRGRHYSSTARGNSHGRKIIWARKLRTVNGYHYKILMPFSLFMKYNNSHIVNS